MTTSWLVETRIPKIPGAPRWLVETRVPPIPGAPREPWQHFAVAQTRQRARDLATFPRAHGYETRVRKRNHEPASELRLGMPRDVDRTSKLR